jgi:hypothetical protein
MNLRAGPKCQPRAILAQHFDRPNTSDGRPRTDRGRGISSIVQMRLPVAPHRDLTINRKLSNEVLSRPRPLAVR